IIPAKKKKVKFTRFDITKKKWIFDTRYSIPLKIHNENDKNSNTGIYIPQKAAKSIYFKSVYFPVSWHNDDTATHNLNYYVARSYEDGADTIFSILPSKIGHDK